MPKRTIPLTNGSIYHVFNRGVGKSNIFYSPNDYARFIEHLAYYNHVDYPYSLYLQQLENRNSSISRSEFNTAFFESRKINPPVSILAYCLMPNHFHLILKQNIDDGIKFFMHKIGTSYAQFINQKNERTGTLFEGRFKHVPVNDQNQLDYLSRYVHRNPITLPNIDSGNLSSYEWSSLGIYLGINQSLDLVDTTQIMNSFDNNISQYQSYVLVDYKVDEQNILEDKSIDDDFDWYKARLKGRALNRDV